MKIRILFLFLISALGANAQAEAPAADPMWMWLFIAAAALLALLIACFAIYIAKNKKSASEEQDDNGALIQEQMAEFQKAISQKDTQIAALTADLEQAIAKANERQAAEPAPSSPEPQTESLKETIAQLNEKIERIGADKATLENKLEEAKSMLDLKEQQLQQMSIALDSRSQQPAPAAAPVKTGYDSTDEIEASAKKIEMLQKELNDANHFREQLEAEGREMKKALIESQNKNDKLQQDLNAVNHAYDQYEKKYTEEKENHEAQLRQLHIEFDNTLQRNEQKQARLFEDLSNQHNTELTESKNRYAAEYKKLEEECVRMSEQVRAEYEKRIAALSSSHHIEIENAKRASAAEVLRVSEAYERKINEQADKHTAELNAITAAHHAELLEKGSLLERKERELDMMQTQCQAEIRRINEEKEDQIARISTTKDAEIERVTREKDSRIDFLLQRITYLNSQLQSARESTVANISNRFDALTPGISRLAADTRATDSESMAAYLAESMLDGYGYAISDFKHATDTLDDSVSAEQVQTLLRTNLAEKWLGQNGWITILAQLTAYARIPAMHASLRVCGVDTMLLAKLLADTADLLGCIDVSLIVPSVLADDFDSASMEAVNARTIIDRINPDIMPRDHVGKVFDLAQPGFSTPTLFQKPRVVYF